MNHTDKKLLGAIVLLSGGLYTGMALVNWLGDAAWLAWIGLTLLFTILGLAARPRETPEFHVETRQITQEMPQRLAFLKQETERNIPSKADMSKDTD